MILMSLQKITKAISDQTRREILNLLKKGRMSAGDIVAHFNITGASISRHLSILKEADLVRDEREGQFIFYELNTSVLEDIMCWIIALKGDDKNDQKES
jgi:DNA-binding transcriptional ArsR family regulator